MKDGAAYELDHLLKASPGSSSVLDIMAASGSRPLPMETDLDPLDPVTVDTQEATDGEEEVIDIKRISQNTSMLVKGDAGGKRSGEASE